MTASPGVVLGGSRTILFGTVDGRTAMQIMCFGGDLTEAMKAPGLIDLNTLRSIIQCMTPTTWTVPADDCIKPLLHTLRLVQVTEPAIPPDPNHRLERIKKALTTLLNELPELSRVVSADQAKVALHGGQTFKSKEQAAAILALEHACVAAKGSFFWRRTRPVRTAPWHSVAHAIAHHAASIWHVNKPGAGLKNTSPVVLLIEALLPRIGCGQQSREAIVSGIRRSKVSLKGAGVGKSKV